MASSMIDKKRQESATRARRRYTRRRCFARGEMVTAMRERERDLDQQEKMESVN